METTMKIECRLQGEKPGAPWQPLTNLDELIWNGVHALRATADDGTLGLPFRVADNDSMTFVVKDHAHDGSLQNNRTIVQTITHVECTTGKVSVYNRTRHYNNGKHRWTDWELACDENGHPTFDNNTVQQVEKNKNDIANEIIRAKSMDEGLDARVTANTTAISNEINRAQNVEQNIKSSLRSTTPRVYIGGLQENGDPYPGTSYSAYSAPVTGNGEIVVSDGYCIDAIKMFAKDGTALSYNNYNGQSYTFDDSYDYQFSFRRKDNGKFTADELKRVVQSLILDTIVWGADKDLNNYRCTGEYHIDGKRENTADNMPIYNIGNINARLTVLNAGGCVTQVLTLLNIGGGDSNIYTRTMQNGTWNMWNKLQSNVEVGAIGLGQTHTFDHLTDNGIYSGVNVYATGTDDNGYPITAFETFVLITINAYLTGGGVSQLKYSLLPDGTTCVAKRSKQENTWSDWRDLESDISTMNKLQTTVDSLVNENIHSKQFEEVVRRSMVDINSRLGHDAGTIVLKASDLIPMTWNGTKMLSSTKFNVWILPLSEGVLYSVENTPFMQSKRTCSEYPVLDKELAMTAVLNPFTATSEMKYLVITVTMSVYDGSDYELSASGHGLMNEFNSLKTRVNETYELSIKTQNHLLQTESELSACIGSKDRTIVLTSNDYDNLLWNGTSFANANNTYNGFVVPIYPGERIRYTAPQANNVCTLTDYPTIGSSERVRTRFDFGQYAEVDFIVQDNEHYLFLNTTVASHTSYEVIAGEGTISSKIDKLKISHSPLYGKRIVCFGDSLTEFNEEGGKGYGDYLAELSGAKVVRGGIGGTQLATRKEPVETIPDTDIAYQHAYGAVDISNLVKAWANNDWGIVDNAIAWLAENKNDNNSAVIDRLKANPIDNTDIVIVFGGSNDLNNSTFGSPYDTDAIKNTCGGINQIIDSILSVKPNMTIYFFTPIPRMVNDIWCDDYRTDQSDDYGSLSFPSLVKRIKECVEYNHIPCCDMYNTIGINRKNIYTYADDGVHPNRGYSILANKIYGFMLANRIWI